MSLSNSLTALEEWARKNGILVSNDVKFAQGMTIETIDVFLLATNLAQASLVPH